MSDCEFRKAVLSNGITLVVETHPHVRSASLGVWVRVGSSDEAPDQNGLSHFIEHMVFKGTARRNAFQIATVLESVGGDLNAFTDREVTCFHATVLKEHVDLALDVLSDLVLHPVFPEEQFDRERKVILQELSLVEETPDDRIHDLFFEAVWPKHPLGRTVLGSARSLKALTRRKLLSFYEKHYRAHSMVISVAGNVEFEAVRAQAERLFGAASPSTGPREAKREKKPRYNSTQRVERLPSELMHLLIGFEGVGFRDEARFDGLLLSFFLGGGMSSRLFQEVREKAGLAYGVECDFIPFTHAGLFSIYLALVPKTLPQCLKIIGREIEQLKKVPLRAEDLAVVQGQLRGTILLGAEQMEVRQESLGRNELVFGRYVPVEEVIHEIEAVTPERIHALANRIFLPKKESFVSIGPKLQVNKKEWSLF